ncbi:MAG: galactokinase [Oscillospiraceae bacterium]|nr:galactokinase [Oscillospiraceae bacterium]
MSITIFAPGRTELSGNHTDHQQGRILASAVDVGLTAVVERGSGTKALLASEGFTPIEADTDQLEILPEDFGTSRALMRGMLACFRNNGLEIGPFSAKVTSTLPSGSGLSSSAAFSVMVGRILNELYNGGKADPVFIAKAAQYAENEYFGKPCGLMDQLACSLGHAVYVDFRTMDIEPIIADFGAMGLTLCLSNTGGSHAGLDDAYASIRIEMDSIAARFGQKVLRDVDPEEFFAKGWSLSERPVRRAKHFFEENERVPQMRDALRNGNGEEYMRLMNASGRSSENLLENIVAEGAGDTKLAEGLELSAKLLEGKGAWRVHGGGFAGCVQALMPPELFPFYKQEMEKAFGEGSCRELKLV